MQYRNFQDLEWKPSALGIGAMRLPVIGNDQSAVDIPEASKMIRYAIDNGVNYVDTAYTYHLGNSEVIVGKALKDGYRDKVHLTTKSPLWLIQKREDFDKYLNEQIDRLQTNPDIYLFHGLTTGRLEKIKKLNLIEKIEEAREKELIKYIGFSFHDSFKAFKERTLAPHTKVFKYRPDMSTVPYRFRGFYQPFKSNEILTIKYAILY